MAKVVLTCTFLNICTCFWEHDDHINQEVSVFDQGQIIHSQLTIFLLGWSGAVVVIEECPQDHKQVMHRLTFCTWIRTGRKFCAFDCQLCNYFNAHLHWAWTTYKMLKVVLGGWRWQNREVVSVTQEWRKYAREWKMQCSYLGGKKIRIMTMKTHSRK